MRFRASGRHGGRIVKARGQPRGLRSHNRRSPGAPPSASRRD
ncbi:hypothetical protein ACFPRL_24045 [Pseudoclavibacter helvolus]